jgi:3-phenylpropionate/trans-cinnamate dioxygenase ferredoxin reductase subunit
MPENCIIIGGSHAGGQLVVSLRQAGWEDDITLIGDEPHVPYQHPPLSKDYLSGEKTAEELLIRPEQAYETAGITLKLGCRVTEINRKNKTVSTNNGDCLRYDKLVLATGARVRRLPIDGADLPGVYYLRDMADVTAIKRSIQGSKKAVIIGGGYIGLETAASLQKIGLKVTVLEAMPRILQRVTAPELSEFYKRIHSEEGVEIKEGVMASSIQKTRHGLTVQDKDGDVYQGDFVIIGIGVIPNTELAQAADLEVGNGIVVNEYCQTTDPNIYAAGDVTWHYNLKYDCHLRLESVPNATEQAKVVAAHICGKGKAYDSLPWFWSDQFDLKLQIAGLSEGYDDLIIRGDTKEGRSFAAFYFKGKRLLAVDAVNAPREFAITRMLLMKGQSLDKEKVADTGLAMKEAII